MRYDFDTTADLFAKRPKVKLHIPRSRKDGLIPKQIVRLYQQGFVF